MKTTVYTTLLLILSLAFMGCPYESEVPITKPTTPIKKEYLGVWNSKDEVYHSYTVTEASPTEYRILQKNLLGETRQFKAHLSEIRGGVFLNLHCDSLNIYYLYRLQIDAPDKIVFIPIDPTIPEHYKNSEDLRHYVEKNMNLQSFYNAMDQILFERSPAKP